MMKLLFLCVIYAIVNGKQWKESEVVEEIKNPTGVIMHERARLYGAEDYMRIKTTIDLKPWKKQEETFHQDLKSIIEYDDVNHIEYMDALSKGALLNLNKHSVDRWINSLTQTIQPLKAILNTKLQVETITATKIDEENDVLYLNEGCPRMSPYWTEATNEKLKEAITQMIASENPTTVIERPVASSDITFNTTWKAAKNQEFLKIIEDRIKVINVVDMIQTKIEEMDEVMSYLNRNQLPLNCLSADVWTKISQMFKFPAAIETKALDTIKWALGKFGLTMYSIDDNETIHMEIIVPNPLTMKKMSLVDMEYYPIKQNGDYYVPSEQPPNMIISQSLTWALPHQAEEKIDENCILSTRTPNQFWCFGLTERALMKRSCLKETMQQGVDDIEECYDLIGTPETEIKNINPYLTLVSPIETETLAITCNDETDTINIDEPSIIELPEGCTGIIDNHKIYGHPWNSDNRIIKQYNELTQG